MATLLVILKILLLFALALIVIPWVAIVLVDTARVSLYGFLYARKIIVEIRTCYRQRDEIKVFASKEKVRCRDDTSEDGSKKDKPNNIKE